MQDRKRGDDRRPAAGKEQVKDDVARARQQQHTGNHERHERETPQPYGADTYGGTRAGAENVEPGGDRDRR